MDDYLKYLAADLPQESRHTEDGNPRVYRTLQTMQRRPSEVLMQATGFPHLRTPPNILILSVRIITPRMRTRQFFTVFSQS